MNSAMLLSVIIFLPTAGALILALGFNKKDVEPMRYFALVITVATFVLTLLPFRDFLAAPTAGMMPAGGIKIPWIAN